MRRDDLILSGLVHLFFFYYRRQRGKSRRVRRRDRYFRFEQGRAFDLEGEITAQRSNSSHHRAFDRKYYDLRCAHFRGERGHHHGGYFSRHQYQIQKSKVINQAGIILSFLSFLRQFHFVLLDAIRRIF